MVRTSDGPHTAPSFCPLLITCQMRHTVQIRGNKATIFVLVQTQLRVLHLVIVDVRIEAHDHCLHVVIMIDSLVGRKVDLFVGMDGPVDVGYLEEIQLVCDASLADHVRFFVGLQWVRFEKGCGGEAAGEYFWRKLTLRT